MLVTRLAVTTVTVHLTLGECRRPSVVETLLPKLHSYACSSLENELCQPCCAAGWPHSISIWTLRQLLPRPDHVQQGQPVGGDDT